MKSICLLTLFCSSLSLVADVRVSEKFGFDPEDSTRYLEAAIRSGENCIILDAKPTPWITSKTLRGRSGQTIVFEKGTTLQAKRGCFKRLGDSLFTFANCTNVTLKGAGPAESILKMWRSDYDDPKQYEHSEWRHGISLLSCVNVRIEGLSVVDTGGDGLYVSTANNHKNLDLRRGCRNVTVKNCVFDRNYRQGISVIGVDGFLVEDVKLTNTKGTPPEAGIDFEPNHTWECLRNIVMRRCWIENNAGSGIDFAHLHFGADTEPNSILIEDTSIVGNKRGFIYQTGSQDVDQIGESGSVTLRNCTLRDVEGQAVVVAKRINCRGIVSFENVTVENCGASAPTRPDFGLSYPTHTVCEPDSIVLSNVTVKTSVKREVITVPKRVTPFRGRPTRLEGSLVARVAGEEKRLVFDDEYRAKHFPHVDVPNMPTLQRVPPSLDKATVCDMSVGAFAGCAPAFLRGRGRFFVFYAKGGETVRFQFWAQTIGKSKIENIKPMLVYARGGKKEIAALEPPHAGERSEAEFAAPSTGFYELMVSTAGNGLAMTKCNVPIALDATLKSVPFVGAGGVRGAWIHSAPEMLSVFVPKGVTFESCIASDVGECCSAALFNPKGERVQFVETVEGAERMQGTADADGLWGIRLDKPAFGAYEDHSVTVKGVPGWLFLTPGRYWR